MNIEAKKLGLIEWIAALNDERILTQIEFFRSKTALPDFNPSKKMTYKELLSDIKQAESDFKEGRTVSLEDLKEEIKKW